MPMTLVLVMAFNILVALGLGFVVGRIYQIRRDELERRAEHRSPPTFRLLKLHNQAAGAAGALIMLWLARHYARQSA
jgi:TRAP-type C4-dicarboxylate transport system permease small subunit